MFHFVHILKTRASLLFAAILALSLMAFPAFAQTANPFTDATSTVTTYMGYALGAGLIGLGTLAAIGLGKAIFRRLTS